MSKTNKQTDNQNSIQREINGDGTQDIDKQQNIHLFPSKNTWFVAAFAWN